MHAVVVHAPRREVGCERFDGVVAGHTDGEVVEARGGARSVGIAAQRESGPPLGWVIATPIRTPSSTNSVITP